MRSGATRFITVCSSRSRLEATRVALARPLRPLSIVRISERVVENAAATGNCVIVGRGSQHFLRVRDDTLRFFLYAPPEEKISRLISQGNSERDAEILVDTVDWERAAFIKRYFHAEWPDRSVYHAMINTASGDETVIQAILSFLQQSEKHLEELHGRTR